MHIYWLLLITAIAALATLYCASNNYNGVITFFFLAIVVAGFMMGILFPLFCVRSYDTATVTSDESIALFGVATDDENTYYLVQHNDSFGFLWCSEVDGLMLTNAQISDVTITYQDGTHYAEIKASTSTYHNEWLFLKDSVTTKTEYEYHFFIPRNAVWYPYETN